MLQPIGFIPDRRIRIALVGCGRISAKHIYAIASHNKRAHLVAICDIQPDRLVKAQDTISKAAEEYPGAATNPLQFDNYYELLAAVSSTSIARPKVAIEALTLSTGPTSQSSKST